MAEGKKGVGTNCSGKFENSLRRFRSLDQLTGLHVFGLRDYDPAAGVWMERDHGGLAMGDANLYRFVANNPVTWVDPTGMEGWFGWVADTAHVANSAYGGFNMGMLQGGANVLNSVTDTGISTINLIPGAWNYTVGFIPSAPPGRLPADVRLE